LRPGNKILENRACHVAEASLSSPLFLGKPVKAGGPDVAAAEENNDLWQLKFV
jgi:hypothetical protein